MKTETTIAFTQTPIGSLPTGIRPLEKSEIEAVSGAGFFEQAAGVPIFGLVAHTAYVVGETVGRIAAAVK